MEKKCTEIESKRHEWEKKTTKTGLSFLYPHLGRNFDKTIEKKSSSMVGRKEN